ncbi:MAG: helix-turn-helix domain-containing protein [Candidatus Omnitrophica bacterium]|nr:helix-turn-helix domain-containing protein [Candidatus Omnitrophota bacterium]
MEISPEEHREYLKDEYLNFQEAAELLEVEEEELRRLVREHRIPTHTIAGVFLRLRKKDVETLKNRWRIDRELFPAPEPHVSHPGPPALRQAARREKWADFWYFNDFYIVCSALIIALLYFIIVSQ